MPSYLHSNRITLGTASSPTFLHCQSSPLLVAYAENATAAQRLYCIFADQSTGRIRVLRRDGSVLPGPVKGTVREVSSPNVDLLAASQFAPAVSSFNGVIWIIYHGENGDQLYLASWNGTEFTFGDALLSAESDAAPAVASTPSCMFPIYKGQGSTQIYEAFYSMQNSNWVWNGDRTLRGNAATAQTSQGPSVTAATNSNDHSLAIIAYRGYGAISSAMEIYLAFTATTPGFFDWYGDRSVTFTEMVPAPAQTPPPTQPPAPVAGASVTPVTSVSPSIALMGSTCYIAYASTSGQMYLISASVPGTGWSQVQPGSWAWQGVAEQGRWQEVALDASLFANSACVTDRAPTAVVYNNLLHIFYKRANYSGVHMVALNAMAS